MMDKGQESTFNMNIKRHIEMLLKDSRVSADQVQAFCDKNKLDYDIYVGTLSRKVKNENLGPKSKKSLETLQRRMKNKGIVKDEKPPVGNAGRFESDEWGASKENAKNYYKMLAARLATSDSKAENIVSFIHDKMRKEGIEHSEEEISKIVSEARHGKEETRKN